jgi:hypothetical protein
MSHGYPTVAAVVEGWEKCVLTGNEVHQALFLLLRSDNADEIIKMIPEEFIDGFMMYAYGWAFSRADEIIRIVGGTKRQPEVSGTERTLEREPDFEEATIAIRNWFERHESVKAKYAGLYSRQDDVY